MNRMTRLGAVILALVTATGLEWMAVRPRLASWKGRTLAGLALAALAVCRLGEEGRPTQ